MLHFTDIRIRYVDINEEKRANVFRDILGRDRILQPQLYFNYLEELHLKKFHSF